MDVVLQVRTENFNSQYGRLLESHGVNDESVNMTSFLSGLTGGDSSGGLGHSTQNSMAETGAVVPVSEAVSMPGEAHQLIESIEILEGRLISSNEYDRYAAAVCCWCFF